MCFTRLPDVMLLNGGYISIAIDIEILCTISIYQDIDIFSILFIYFTLLQH